MTREQAKDKIMQLYGSLSEDMKRAIDTLLDVPADMMPLAVKAEAMKAYRELTGDYVSRKAVEEITWEEPTYSDKYNVLTEVRDKVRELPSATPDLSEYSDKLWKRAYERGKAEAQEWIPVSERLPKTEDEVLVTDGVDYFIAWCTKDFHHWISTDSSYDPYTPIIAWMPLPAPYEQKEEG